KEILFFCASLIILGAIIAPAIVVIRNNKNNPQTKIKVKDEISGLSYSINTISEDDNVLGNPNANVVLINYSDFQCPHCREFHSTVIRLVANYSKTGDFAWVYRHFPTEEAVGKAKNSISKKASVASECVKEISGPTAFWDFIHEIYTSLPIDFDEADLQTLASKMNVNQELYLSCINSGRYDAKIQKHIEDGLAISKKDKDFGTPYNIFITRDGRQIILPGPQSYTTLNELVRIYSTTIRR
ncbi:MAG TPA: thioredoxin domain-containing protein, partial [Candidatus Paceibacterota bacterium]|nr:thioredoxin domain-containing protein [Candidatus Paceibacterota bacterium]